jgi:hypothetical protein
MRLSTGRIDQIPIGKDLNGVDVIERKYVSTNFYIPHFGLVQMKFHFFVLLHQD